MESSPFVAIVVVCYNGVSDTLECLASLSHLTYPNAQTVVVDNGGSDDTAGKVREAFPGVHVLETGDNLGFAGGNNVGVRFALETLGAAYVFLLNNDTTVEPGLLEPLVVYAEANPKAGIVAPLMCYFDAPETVWSAGGVVDYRAQSRLVGEGEPATSYAYHAPREQDFVVGCGMLVRRDVWEAVSGFDERFFLYYEESDLCYRARRLDFVCVTVATVRLWHKVSRSTGASSDLTLYYMRRNALLFLEKNGTFAGRLAVIADNLRLLTVWTAKHNPRRAVLRESMGDYFGRRFGKRGSGKP